MSELAEYLMRNYYSKYNGGRPEMIPKPEDLEKALELVPEKIIVIREPEIKGVAVYLTLSDETYKELEKHDISNVNVLSNLIREQGDNIHFVLLAADGLKTIMLGIDEIKKKRRPKSISWWSPDMRRLHRYNLN